MNKNIYANSDEKFVKATVLFSSENKIYYDEACTEEVTLEDALNLFKKGLMLVSVDGGFKRPTGINVTESGYEISYGGNGGDGGAEVPIPDADDDDNKVAAADGTTVKWKSLNDLATLEGFVLVPAPTSEEEGYVLKAVSGVPTWVSGTE